MLSPTQAIGRYDSVSSFSVSPSSSADMRAILMMLSKVRTTPLGWPVVPEV